MTISNAMSVGISESSFKKPDRRLHFILVAIFKALSLMLDAVSVTLANVGMKLDTCKEQVARSKSAGRRR